MANITLKQLRYFEALAQQGHFGRAAESSSVSQPALSVQIRELEENVGMTLFERGARQVRLTGFGEEFALRVRDILRAVDDLDELARLARDRLIGRLRIGIIPTIAPYLLPRIIGLLSEAHPGLDVHVRETQTGRLIEELIEGRIDTAILALPISESSLVECPIFCENLLFVRPAHQEGLPVPDAERLKEMRLLLLEEGHCFRDQALSFCDIRTGRPREGLDASSLSTLVQMVSSGIGVTLIPEMALWIETRAADVSIVPFPDPQPARTIGMVWRRSSPLTQQMQDIADLVRQAGAAVLGRDLR